ncbi:hypothetical protein KJZ63_01000 [Patescibacteria group bacterium]|nr:hypothetical protein [Patescibacteria group bacterium]
MLSGLHKFFAKSFWLYALLVVFVSLIVSRSLFNNNLATTHDLEIHAARTANYYLALKQGQLPPRWAPNLNYGFGYPVYNFSYHYPYFVSALLFGITDSVELSLNLFMAGSVLIGGLGVYLLAWLKLGEKYKGRSGQAFIISLAYLTAPYILLNVFVRGALGEIGFWSLLPVVMIFFLLRQHTHQWWYLLAFPILLVAWFLSHQVLVLLSLPVLILWQVVEVGGVKKFLRSDWRTWLGLIFLSLLMVLFSWLPMVTEKKFVALGYDNYQPHSYAEQFPPNGWLLYSPWEYSGLVDRSENGRFTRMIGFEYWLVAVGGVWLIGKGYGKSKNKAKYFFWLGAFWTTLFLMLPISLGIWKICPPLQYIQHPWRLIGWCVVAGTMIWLEWLINNKNSAIVKLINGLVLLSSIWAIWFWAKPVATFHKPVEQWLEYHLTGDSYSELTPVAFDRGENLAFPEKLYFLDGNDNLSKLEPINLLWTGNLISYNFETTQSGRVIQKTANFPGWKVEVNGQPINVDDNVASWSGRVTYWVSGGANQVKVFFDDKKTSRELANRLSILGLGLWLVGAGVLILRKSLNQFQNR